MSLLQQAGKTTPALDGLGPHIAVPFGVRRVRSARLLWLNDRWFLERGVDSRAPDARHEIETELVDQFAVSTPDAAREIAGAARELLADRYGGSGGAVHGGSGRCGHCGPFNAKGVGRTPLVSPAADPGHAHGCLWLEEAVREAICAEIAACELPFGAIPVVAIIDLGIACEWEGRVRRRAIVVRPNFVRLAHFERSIYFGQQGAEQRLDVLRVEQAIASASAGDTRSAGGFSGLRTTFLRLARQLGAARAHRLWHGRFLTSNLSVDGALADFGAFRTVPSWRRATGDSDEVFGEEERQVRAAIDSLCFHFRKFAPKSSDIPLPHLLQGEVEAEIARGFHAGCLEALRLEAGGDGAPAREVCDILRSYYDSQQHEQIFVGDRKSAWSRPWLHDAFEGRPHDLPDRETRTALALSDAILRDARDGGWHAAAVRRFAAVRSWLRPRPLLYREYGEQFIAAALMRLTGESETDRNLVETIIRRTLSRARRVWRSVPRYLEIAGQRCDTHCSVLHCRDRRNDAPAVWLEAARFDRRVYVFDRVLDIGELGNLPGFQADETSCRVEIAPKAAAAYRIL